MIHDEHEGTGGRLHAVGELTEMGARQRGVRKSIRRQERLADVDDGHREPERPGHPRDGRRVVASAEDHEVWRRHRDLEEQVGAADRLGTRRGVRRAQPVTGALDRLLFDEGIGQPSGDAAGLADDHPARDAGEWRDEHRRVPALEYRQPLTRDRVVFEPLGENVDGAAAADAQTPDRIVRQVVAHEDRLAGGDHARRGLGNRRFQATAGQRTLVGPVLTHEHPRAFAPIRAPFDADHRRQRRRLAGRTRLTDDLEEPFGLTSIHTHEDTRTNG